jgi:hypothetical protein
MDCSAAPNTEYVLRGVHTYIRGLRMIHTRIRFPRCGPKEEDEILRTVRFEPSRYFSLLPSPFPFTLTLSGPLHPTY